MLDHVGDRGDALERGAHAVAVVLATEDDGELPDGGHVQRFVEGADVHGRLAEIAEAHLVAVAVLDCEAEPGGERDVAAHDPVPAHEPLFRVEEVHRAALAA